MIYEIYYNHIFWNVKCVLFWQGCKLVWQISFKFRLHWCTWAWCLRQFSFILTDVCLIEFIGVTLVNKFMLASGVQFYNTSSVYCTMCSPPQVKSLSINTFLILPWSTSSPPPFPSGTHRTVVCLLGFVVVVNSFTFFTQHPNPLPCFKAVCSLCLYMSLFLFCLLVYFVH